MVFAGREQRTEFLVEMLTNKNIVATDDEHRTQRTTDDDITRSHGHLKYSPPPAAPGQATE